MNQYFQKNATPTSAIVDLLEQTTLGTNGAQYRLLNTSERIQLLGESQHLTLERNERVLANISFCYRNNHQYVRYFAFDKRFQSNKPQSKTKNGLLRNYLNEYFKTELEGDTKSFYAYLDPNNERSLMMTEQFGFVPCGSIVTQTFSRLRPKKALNHQIVPHSELPREYTEHLSKQKYAFNDYRHLGTYHAIKDANGRLLCIAHADEAAWEIKRLPGKYGAVLTHMMSYIPILNQFIRPKHHRFGIVDSVYLPSASNEAVQQLFESILVHYDLKTLNWWVDAKSTTYTGIREKLSWGLMDKIIGRPEVLVCSRGEMEQGTEHFVSGYDLT